MAPFGVALIIKCLMAVAKPTGGLRRWFKEDWVDIGSPEKDGGFKKCGRKSTTESS
jgi:hypothetical protein